MTRRMTRKLPPAVSRATSTAAIPPIIVRRFARAAVELPAQYAREDRPSWQWSVIDDLGGGGVRLQTKEDFEPGTLLLLRFDIKGRPVRATARVAMSLFNKSSARYIHGLAFTAIDPVEQKIIVERVFELRGVAG